MIEKIFETLARNKWENTRKQNKYNKETIKQKAQECM